MISTHTSWAARSLVTRACIFAALAFHSCPAAPSLPGAKVLLLVDKSHSAHATDDRLKKHFESVGYVVTMADQLEPAAQQLEKTDLVFVSATVDGNKVSHSQAETYRQAAVPIINCKAALLGRLGMTGLRAGSDWGTAATDQAAVIILVNATHPMQAEIPNGPFNLFKGGVRQFDWGKPGVAAINIAFIPGHLDRVTNFGYDRGAMMEYPFEAPARRLMFCLPAGGFDQLADNARWMLNDALTWALGLKPMPR